MWVRRPKLTNLDQVFCKMSMSIWIRGTTIFLAVIFTFLAPKIGHFWGAWSLCQIWGSTLPSLRFCLLVANLPPSPEGYHFARFEVLPYGTSDLAKRQSGEKQWAALCQIWGSALMEPQIWQSGHLASRGPKKISFLGVKNGKKVLFFPFSARQNI